jgi:chitin disaccharide deacetylase
MTADRLLIVNADDFGAGRGINRGVLDAHQRGIVTSASLMVDRPGAEEAAAIARSSPRLSVGLHICLTTEEGRALIDYADGERCRADILRQVALFQRLVGRTPSHLDTHHNIQRDPRLLPELKRVADEYGLRLREHSEVRYFPEFYGQWDGVMHPEQISVESLARMLTTKIGPGVTELSCHPGYADSDFQSTYARERELEIEALCDPSVPGVLAAERIRLVNFSDIGRQAPSGDIPCRLSY